MAKYTEALIGADFKTSPYRHQLREFEYHAESPARAMLWHMRTGKSKECIDRACHLYLRGLVDAVLIFAPNGVHANWLLREVPLHAWQGITHRKFIWKSAGVGKLAARFTGNEEERVKWWDDLELARKKSRALIWLSVNTESMTRPDVRKAVAKLIKARRVLLLVDESDDFGTPGSKRTKMVRSLSPRCPFKIIMSGTTVDGSPLAAFSQFEILKRGALGFDTYEEFKHRYADYMIEKTAGGRSYPKLIEYKNLEELRERMAQWSSVVLREDCDDMPELLPERIDIERTEEQKKVAKELRASFLVELNGEEFSIGEKAQKLQKLQQVFSSFVKDEFGDVRIIPGGNPRLDALSTEVMLASGKVVIWAQFQKEIDDICARLRMDGHKIVEYHGRVSNESKLEALQTFSEEKSIKGLVGHAFAGGRGLDLSAASAVIWYSHTFSARKRRQANERATKIAGRNVRLIDFVAGWPDTYILETTEGRFDVADMLAGNGLKELLEGMAL